MAHLRRIFGESVKTSFSLSGDCRKHISLATLGAKFLVCRGGTTNVTNGAEITAVVHCSQV